jgi:predicted GIY-YIG superfamily endonuclease
MKTTIVYLLCFDAPYKHAKHYLGSTTDLERCLSEHEQGRHGRLTQVLHEHGITFTLARTWAGDKQLERRLKNRGGARRLCPLCQHGD